jgi:hypothetical protein
MSSIPPPVMPPGGAARQRRRRHFAGKAPRNKGHRYPADPPTVDEIVAVMRVAGQARYGARLNGLVVVLRRAGLPPSGLAMRRRSADTR